MGIDRRCDIARHGHRFRAAARDPNETRRVAVVLLPLVLVFEGLVAVRFSVTVGIALLAATGGLSAFTFRGLRVSPVAAEKPSRGATAAEHFFQDELTGLPNRQQLIEQLSRDIARAQRYKHDLTLTFVQVSQFAELNTAWGAATAASAVVHVSETLRRVTRTPDFLARVDEDSFAVLLTQCSQEQANLFGERVSLAVSNRPLKSAANVSIPLYVAIGTSSTQYDASKFRGPLDFLSAAGGDVMASGQGARRALPHDPQALRPQLVHDYYPEGEPMDFAEAYRHERSKAQGTG